MDEKKGISLTELIQSLFKRWYILLVTIILGVTTTGVLAFAVVTPQYRSTAEIMVQWFDGTSSSADLVETYRILETVANHFKTDLVLEDVIEELEMPITLGAIKSGLTVTHTTQVFYVKISFTYPDKDIAKSVAQQIVLSGKKIADSGQVPLLDNTFVIINAAKQGVYVSPNKTLYLIVGFLLGGILGATIIFVLEFGRYTFKTKEDLEDYLDIQVIGLIPEYTVSEKELAKAETEKKAWEDYLKEMLKKHTII